MDSSEWLRTSADLQQKLTNTIAELALQRKQTEELRKLLSKPESASHGQENFQAPATSNVWQMRYEVLEERKNQLQKENFELRRQLAGLTPDRLGPTIKSPYSRCVGCLCLKKQRARQTKFFENLLLESRNCASSYQKQCEILTNEVDGLKMQLTKIQNLHEDTTSKQRENIILYKKRSERLEKRNRFELQGYGQEIVLIKSKLQNIDKALVKTQLNFLNKQAKIDLFEELKKLTSDSILVTDRLHRLNKQLN